MLKRFLFFIVLTLLLLPFLPSSFASPPQDTYTGYLPLVYDSVGPEAPNGFGVEIIQHGYNAAPSAELAQAAGFSWGRVNRLRWLEVEPTAGTYDWNAIAPLESALATFGTHNINSSLVIGEVPVWAREHPDSACGPIRADALDDFAAFVAAVAARYQVAPYHLRYIELFNEPDVAHEQIPPGATYGCWGDSSDSDYYGGRYYSTMLSAVYSRVKAVAPDVQIVTGGLLLACDYTHDYDPSRDCTPSRFLRGILQEGRGQNFDILGIHGYAIHSSTRRDWDSTFATWAHRGGITAGKLSFVHEELRAIGVTKPVLFTEGGMVCYEGSSCNQDQTLLHDDQAIYMVRMHARVRANGGQGAFWYALEDPGWRHTGLLGENLTPRPAYYAAQFLTSWMADATYDGKRGDGVGELEGYAFHTPAAQWEVYWSNDVAVYPLPLPDNANLYTKTGEPLPYPPAGIAVIGFEPLIVEIPNGGT